MIVDKDIFIDTSAFIAMRVKDDINHERAKKFLKVIQDEYIGLHTSNFILDEVYTYFCKAHKVAMEMAELIMNNPIIVLHRISYEDEELALKILRQHNDKDYSYTDATSFSIMGRLNLKTAFAFDDHFSQYGKFIVLPYTD